MSGGNVNRIDQRIDAVDVVPSSDETRTLGKELSLVEQLVGNIGRFSDRDGPAGGKLTICHLLHGDE
ncbi:MAG: hypothetical protein R3D03_15625 [Geminicoccaceae bacterium]